MTKQLLIYSRAQAVNKQKHLNYSVKAGSDYRFAKDINSIPLMAVEFFNAASDYAIVFAGGEESIMPVVVVGVRPSENLYVKADGSVDAKYIPAFLRRYPFVFSSTDEGKNFTLCIDEDFEGFNKEGKGERLFDADGNQTQYLNNVLEFSKEYQSHFLRTQNFCKTLKELDLLEPMQAQFTPPESEKLTLTGFMAINRTKLQNLPADKLSELSKSGILELAYLQLHSMQNFTAMLSRVNLANARDKTAKVEPSATTDTKSKKNGKEAVA